MAVESNKELEAEISMHFGRCPYYVIVEVDKGEIKQPVKVIANPYASSHGQPGEVPFFLKEQQIDVIIAGGMGPRAMRFFNQYGIRVIAKGKGKVKEVVEDFLKGKIKNSKPCH